MTQVSKKAVTLLFLFALLTAGFIIAGISFLPVDKDAVCAKYIDLIENNCTCRIGEKLVTVNDLSKSQFLDNLNISG